MRAYSPHHNEHPPIKRNIFIKYTVFVATVISILHVAT